MLQRLLPNTVLALGLAVVLAPSAAQAQVREVVSKQVSVSRSEASLALEFSDESTLEVSLRDGSVLIDGARVGSFEPGGDLDTAWRELLGRAVALEDGPLSEALSDWTVPAGLAGSLADVALSIDQALEESLAQLDVQTDPAEGTVSISIGNERSFLRALLGSTDRIGMLPEALAGLGSDVRLHVGEDVEIGQDEIVSGTLVAIDGDVLLEGRVEGDVVVIGGSLDLMEGSRVGGDVRLADARLVRNAGSVGGALVRIDDGEVTVNANANERIRNEVRNEVRNEIREELRRELRRSDREDEGGSILTAPFRTVTRAVGGLLENALMVLVLGLLGAGAVMFAGEKVDVISETARHFPGRSAMVGLAGTFLLLPAWVLGFVALVVSIIGIPVAIAWLPLFPVAAVVAAVVGYLAVARNTGEWLADSEYPWTGWIRKSNPLITMVGGLVGLMALFAAANVLSIVPFFGLVTGLVAFVATVVTFVAVQIGFGAVLLSRAGRRREQWSGGYTPDEAWEAAMSVDIEDVAPDTGTTDDMGGEEKSDA